MAASRASRALPKRDEERVTLRIDLVPAVATEATAAPEPLRILYSSQMRVS